MNGEGTRPLRALLKEVHSTARKAQALRNRLEEHLTAPMEDSAPEGHVFRGGQAAVLAEAILGSAASQKMAEVVRWVARDLDFIRSLWPLALSADRAESLPLALSFRQPMAWGLAPLEYETTTAEDEENIEREADGGDGRCREEEKPRSVGVNLYFHIEPDLADAAEGLVAMPKLANAIAEGLIACRRVNIGFCAVVVRSRETAQLLEGGCATRSAVAPSELRALEAAVADVCDAVRSLLRAVQRGVALMQTAMDGVEQVARRPKDKN